MQHIKVLHINTSGVGGAAIACHRLHRLMLSAGLHSKVLHLYNNIPKDENFSFIGYSAFRRFTNHALYDIVHRDLKPEAYVFNEPAPISSGIANHPLLAEADVIYLHWVLGGFFSKKDFEEVAQLGKPIFCFTHDMWWITGGCHYVFDCNGYKTGCKTCHLHKHFPWWTRSQATWKKEFYSQHPNIRFISPSDWLRKCTDAAYAVGTDRCDFIPNIVPDSIFHYIDKKVAREHFDLPQNKTIVSFGTADNKNWVKGINYLVEALNSINNPQLMLCVYGSDGDKELERQIKHPIRFLGRLCAEEVAFASAAADVFVSPTIAESFGQTLLENIKCGTPVISTRTTAVPEIVKDGINGFLVEPRNSKQLLCAILNFISNPLKLDGSFNEIFSEQSIIARHIEVIKKALLK